MSKRSTSCVVCGRSRVPLVYSVQGRLFTWPWGPQFPSVPRTGHQLEHFRRLSIAQRTTARCLLTAECTAVYGARQQRQKVRGRLPQDATLRQLHKARRGWCKWCGGMVYRRRKSDGAVVQDLRRMWHDGREVHPDAEREARCVQEYNAQAFTFREQVKQRDRGVCAACGRDCEAEHAAWQAQRPDKRWDEENAADWYSRSYEERDAEYEAWRATEPDGWDADHVVPLEDGGAHTLANAQTLCKACHTAKTARENSERAARRRGDEPDRQLGLGDSMSLR